MGEIFSKPLEGLVNEGASKGVDPIALLTRMEAGNYGISLTRQEEQVVFLHYRSLGVDSEEKRSVEGALIAQYRLWSVKVAHQFGMSAQEGMRSLQKAVQNFDPSRGARFTTYSLRAMRGIMLRERAWESGSMHLPGHVYEELNALAKKEARSEMTPEEHLRLAELRRFVARKAEYQDIDAIDAYTDPELYEQESPEDPLAKEPAYNVFRREQSKSQRQRSEDPFELIAQKELLQTLIARLTPTEQKIVRLRLTGMTPEEVGHAMGGVLKSRIRALERRIVAQLKNYASGLK